MIGLGASARLALNRGIQWGGAAARFGFAVGNPADLVVIDASTPEQAVAEIRPPLGVWKRCRRTVIRYPPPELLAPHFAK